MARKSSVDKLKEKLYSPSQGPKVDPEARTPLSSAAEETPRSWSDVRPATGPLAEESAASSGDMLPPRLPTSMTTRKKRSAPFYFLLGSIIFFIIAGGVAAFTFLTGGNTISPQNIDVEIVAPPLIDSGKQATLEFLISNKNDAPLQAADLIIGYPDGTRDAQNPTQALTHQRITIGDIAPGGEVKKTVGVLFYGPEGSQETVNATLEYQLAGSNAVFTRSSNAMLTVGSAPVTLSVSAPDQAISGQPFSMDVTVTSNTNSPLQNVAVQAQYPFGFVAQNSSPTADVGNTLWRLGDLSPGDSKTIHLTGMLTGEDGDDRVFHFLVGSESDLTESTLAVPLLSVPQTVTVRKPFLSGQILLDGQTGGSVAEPLGRIVQGTVQWRNNASTTLTNVTLALTFVGEALDPSTVQAGGGFYDSTKSQILWSSQQDPELASVPPGASGTLQFSFATYPPTQRALVNPTLALNLTVHAAGTETGAPNDVSSAASATINLASSVALSAQATHASGPLPPKVGQQTAYTIAWTVKNSSNTIAGSQVTATLPLYATFAGSSGAEKVGYDAGTRTVTWNLGDLKAGTGYQSPARQASFQVTLTPSLSQVGTAPELTGSATFSGQDRFAQATVQAGANAPTTQSAGGSGLVSQ